MLSNKTYRFIFVILTLREGKRFVSFVPTEVNRSNERQEHLCNLVWFYIGAPQQAKRAVESTEKKGNVAAFSLQFVVVLPVSQRLSSKYHIDGFITLNILHPSKAQCVEVTMFFVMYCKNFLFLSCALLRRIFS